MTESEKLKHLTSESIEKASSSLIEKLGGYSFDYRFELLKKIVLAKIMSYSKVFSKNLNPTSDSTVIYNECFCHNFGLDGGGVYVCCTECCDATPSCIARREHNKKL